MATAVNQKGAERDNFYRLNSLIVDNSKDASINILELHLSNTNQTFERFINLNQHVIYHLCFNKPCCEGSCTLSGKPILQVSQLELLFDKNSSTFPGHSCTSGLCCRKAKSNIQTDVLDISLAYSLLINFCADVFWYCCLDVKSRTLEDFLNIHKHDIYHLTFGPSPCCQCPPGYSSPVTKHSLKQIDWKRLFSGSGQPCNLPLKCPHSCCSVTATPGIAKSRLIKRNHLTTVLHTHFCKARKHLEVLRNYRNGLFAHPKEGALSDHEYQSAVCEIKKAILHIGKVCNKEKETKDALDDLERRPLDHYSFLQHHICTLQQAINLIELKESIDGIVTHRVNEIVYLQSETQARVTALRGNLIRITEEEDISDNVRAKINHVINGMPGTQTGNIVHMKITPTRTVKDLKDLIEGIEHDFPQANNVCHSAHFYTELRMNIENSGVFKPSDQSIEENMIRYLPDGMTDEQKNAYADAISAFKDNLKYMKHFEISALTEQDLTHLLNEIKVRERNEVMKKLLKDITSLMKDCRRRHFIQCMQYMSAYYNLCVLWDIVVLYLSSIFSINSGHSNTIANAVMDSIHQQRDKDKELIQCLAQPPKETVIFALLYTPNQWLSVKSFLDSRGMKSESLDYLCSGQFTITPLEYNSSKVYVCNGGSFLRWTYSNNKWTNFKFESTTKNGKTYFHIFPADYPNHYVTMGVFSWYVICKKGDQEECNDRTWNIKRFKYNTDDCYVLCTKDSNVNCMSYDFTGRIYAKRGVINTKKMFLINKSNSANGDSNSFLMQAL